MWSWIKKVYLICKDNNVDISYVDNENDFTMEFSRADRNEVGELSGEISGEISGELSEEELSVLSVFRSNRKAIKDDVIKETGLSSRTIDRIIKSLKEKELLRRVGSEKRAIGIYLNNIDKRNEYSNNSHYCKRLK